jgi:hypothetical protein
MPTSPSNVLPVTDNCPEIVASSLVKLPDAEAENNGIFFSRAATLVRQH